MTKQRRTSLKQLQKLDMRIHAARQRIQDFDPLLEEVEKPALTLESELQTSRTRLKEMKLEERRLELSVDEKRTREKRLDERLGSVRNLREEAAVSAELEMVKRALQNDEQEALTLLDQIRKMEDRLGEVEVAFEEARGVVQPQKDELLAQRQGAEKESEALRDERARFVAGMVPGELKIYEAIRSGGRGVAVAELTPDGACGHCFGMVPLQVQNEVRHGTALIRCEGCGVILAAPEPETEATAAVQTEAAAATQTEAAAAMQTGATAAAPGPRALEPDRTADDAGIGDPRSDDDATFREGAGVPSGAGESEDDIGRGLE
jgi:hypothetical protein